MEVWRYIVSGLVQGVGYRNFVLKFVHNFTPEVKGYVRNLKDGSVEVLAFGKRESLIELQKHCLKGPRLSIVEKVDIIQMPHSSKEDCGDDFTIWRF